MHKDLPSHLLPQHPLQQQKQQQHRLLPQQREQKKQREQEEDPVSDYDSDIDNNDDELAPFPCSSSRYHQTNGNANSNSTRNSNDYYTHRSSSRADQSRSQSQAGMVQSMNNYSGLKSSPPPESHPTHRQEDSGRGDLSDEEHWSREDARREGFRRWKVIRRQGLLGVVVTGEGGGREKKNQRGSTHILSFFFFDLRFLPLLQNMPPSSVTSFGVVVGRLHVLGSGDGKGDGMWIHIK